MTVLNYSCTFCLPTEPERLQEALRAHGASAKAIRANPQQNRTRPGEGQDLPERRLTVQKNWQHPHQRVCEHIAARRQTNEHLAQKAWLGFGCRHHRHNHHQHHDRGPSLFGQHHCSVQTLAVATIICFTTIITVLSMTTSIFTTS